MQSLGCFIDFVSKHSVTRPIQNSRELVVSHSASLAELPLYGNPLSYWASTNSCSEPKKENPRDKRKSRPQAVPGVVAAISWPAVGRRLAMGRKTKKGRLVRLKTKLGLPDLEQAKATILTRS